MKRSCRKPSGDSDELFFYGHQAAHPGAALRGVGARFQQNHRGALVGLWLPSNEEKEMAIIHQGFHGFSPETLEFLKNLKKHNEKSWFDAHKPAYETHVLGPLRELVLALGDFMLTIDPDFEVTPAVNKTISRIYRDTRFSKDKSPFRSSLWITFKRPGKEWQNAPAYFFEIAPEDYRYGMGFYCAATASMSRLRRMIDDAHPLFLDVFRQYSEQTIFSIEGETFKRILDKSKPAELQAWYQRKNIYFVCNRQIDEALLTPRLVDELIQGFGTLEPLYQFLWDLRFGE